MTLAHHRPRSRPHASPGARYRAAPTIRSIASREIGIGGLLEPGNGVPMQASLRSLAHWLDAMIPLRLPWKCGMT